MVGECLSNYKNEEWCRGRPATDTLLINDRGRHSSAAGGAQNSVTAFSTTCATTLGKSTTHSTRSYCSSGLPCSTECYQCNQPVHQQHQQPPRFQFIGRLVAEVVRDFLGNSAGSSSQPVELEIRLRVGTPSKSTAVANDVLVCKEQCNNELDSSFSKTTKAPTVTHRAVRPHSPPPSPPHENFAHNGVDMPPCQWPNEKFVDTTTNKHMGEVAVEGTKASTPYENEQALLSSELEDISHSIVEVEVEKELEERRRSRYASTTVELDTTEAFGSEVHDD